MSSSVGESSLRAKAFARRPSGFLCLAPATSSSYPQMPASRPAPANGAEPSSRRSSSASSTGPRVLKLGPVHWGEHLDDHKEDFYSEKS
ncbi:hypothetical protein HRG_006608 [Hirsutella rhossiliensis]|uniref:Uncharacterized protein n=1 Tax=Hirsutella rhossiliensis TaxID=111463 RepID=A0A9P8SH56_9HYPO|nr:uncharacterized protein HRG_06608 [Hirsutella rhossiliensis]KAH0962506.1 hypothetical protein HRG_06608 [Hirsutella rhossiliensis]